jgi:hypothetical protein
MVKSDQLIGEIERLIRQGQSELIKCVHCDGTGTCRTTAWISTYGSYREGEAWSCEKCGKSVVASYDYSNDRNSFLNFRSRAEAKEMIGKPTCVVCRGIGQVRI